MRWCTNLMLALVLLAVVAGNGFAQLTNLPTVYGFEGTQPAYWNPTTTTGATLTWATDQSHSMGHSLKIDKPAATADSAAWLSSNMCDIWSPINNKNVDIFLGAYVRTQGVNTNPSSNDARWYIAYDFWDSAGAFIGETKLPIPQTSASSGQWLADTNGVGATILPKDAWTTIVKFVAGKNATGTVWADDFMLYGRAGQWAGQDWNTNLGVPSGWYYWLPPNGGNDGLLNDGFENTVVTSEAAHSGMNSLKFNLPFTRIPHDGYVATRRTMLNDIGAGTLNEGDWIRISVWIKASNLVPDSAALYPSTWSVGLTPLFFTGTGNNLGYSNVGPGPDLMWKFPAVTSFDWTKYSMDIQVPTGVGAKALEVRLHVYSRFTGTIYFDDLDIEKLDIPQISTVGGFEGTLPAYWNPTTTTGATLTWATDQSHSMGHSLKIDKPAATADSAAWLSSNMCDIWSPINNKNVDIFLGAYVRTQGVNTNPSSNDARWYIAYDFWDSAGAFIGETKLPIPQTSASSGQWLADTNGVGATILPKDAWTTIVKFVAGKNATGTVWADDFMLYGRAGQWAGQDWNTNLGVPSGWYYWLPPNGGNDGLLNDGFENTVVTSEAAHSGMNSLKFNLPFTRVPHDGYVATHRFMLDGSSTMPRLSNASGDLATLSNVKEGDVLRISVWIKASNLVPDSAALYPNTWSVGMTPLFFTGDGNNLGYSNVGPGPDLMWSFPPVTSFDWTRYYFDVQVPKGVGAKALEVRLHVYSRFTGTIYFDDLTVEKLDIPAITGIGSFEGTLPAYWNPTTTTGATLTWATDQSHSMGHSLKIDKPAATADSAAWLSSNMCDIWSPINNKNVDIFLGAYVRTQGVNTNPSSNDARWYIAYDFWDSAGAFIGETKLPIPQTSASSGQWLADTNGVGATILPKDAWTTIVKFVAGKNATGTVWADDFMLYGRAGQWAGQDWNTNLGVPSGWYYWLPPNGGNDGLLNDGFENTVVTSEAAHSGMNSLKFNLPFTRVPHDGYVATHRFMLDGSDAPPLGKANKDIRALTAAEGDIIRLTVWIKASNLVPDSAALYPNTWSVGLTPLFFTGTGNNLGYSNVGPGPDLMWAFPNVTQFDWTPYSFDVQVPTGVNAKALEVRLHVYSRFTGTIYFDDLSAEVIQSATGIAAQQGLPKTYELQQNYPNPFNPTTNIQFAVPRESQVTLTIYNILGQKVRTLVDDNRAAGRFEIVWDGKDDHGATVGTGLYLYRLQAGDHAIVRKMLLLK